MCGIIGLITKAKNGFGANEIEALSLMLHSNQIRGSDGTGIFYNSKANKGLVKVLKAAIPACDFIRTSQYNKAKKTFLSEANFVIGHNRSATKGKIDDESTHPFKEKHITLIHNGTLETQKELHKTIEVDSHAICHSMAEIGAEETLKKINGAFTLVWWNAISKTLNFCRNISRPLYIIETKSNHIITSELELGLWVCERYNFTVISKKSVETNKIYTFDITNMDKYTTKDVEYRKFTWEPYKSDYNSKYDYLLSEKKEPTKFFSFGEKIKFKSGPIFQTTDLKKYVMHGSILKHQNMPTHYSVFPDDFEKEDSIRIFGTMETLLPLVNKQKLTGTIARTFIKHPKTTYIVENVHETTIEDEPKQLVHYKQETEEVCEWCKGPIKNPSSLYNYTVCETCASDYDIMPNALI